MKGILNKSLPALLVAMLIALSGLFLQVSGHELRIVKIEEATKTTGKLATSINHNQARILYKLCLLVNDVDMFACHKG